MTVTRLVLPFLLILVVAGTARSQEAADSNDPVQVFDHVWHSLDRHYAMFESKRVDWDAIDRIYRPQVTPETTDGELFTILIDMLRHLNDAHVAIDDGSRRVSAGFIEELDMDDFSVDLVRATKIVADRFADRRRHYMTTRIRYGRGRGDFDLPRYWNVEPDGPAQFTGPTILLTHRFSESAAEGLALAMRVLPHVTIVGDLTGGAFSSQFAVGLPNGWTLSIAYKLILDHRGVCWDGIGLPPDLRVTNTPADIAAGADRVLGFAIDLLERGELKPQDESSSLASVKTSVAAEFLRDVETRGLEAAEAALRERVATEDQDYFFAADDGLRVANDCVNSGRFAEAIVLAKVCRELLPQVAMAYGLQAFSHLALGETEAARSVMAAAEAAGVEPMLPWETPLLDRVKASLAKE